jgi:ABC-2 type transport system ATP-binding protein
MSGPVQQEVPALEARGLTKRYGRLTAIEEVTFAVAPGEIVGFLGPNGAGKSTTLRILAGRLLADRGRASVVGESLALDPGAARRRLAYMPENNPLPDEVRVREYLELRARLKAVPEEDVALRVDQVLHDCDLRGRAGSLIGQLSKGFRQRVGIADTLVGSPEVILLDEPTIGLDPHQILGIRELLRSLRGRMAVLISSHILPEVEQVCDRVIIINRGRIVAQGRAEDLRRELLPAPALRLDADLPAAALRDLARGLDPAAEVTQAEDGRLRVLLPEGSPARASLLGAVVGAGHAVRSMAEEPAGLEEIFLAATRRDAAAREARPA